MARPKERINLFRPVLTTRTAVAPKTSWMVALLVALVLAGAAMAAWDVKKRWDANKAIAEQEAARDRAKQQLETLADQLKLLTSGMTAQISGASTELLPLISQRTKWLDLFQDMSVRVPDGVWLLKMNVETLKIPKTRGRVEKADKKTIALTGFARSYQSLEQLLAALEQSPKFSSVILKSAERKADKAGEQVNFEIAGQLL